MTEQNNRVALVTGASKGIGASIAKRLAQDDFAVVVNYANGEDAAADVVKAIMESGGVAMPVKADVSDPAAVVAMFDMAEQHYGGVDVLVNNAGIMSLSPLAQVEDEAFDRMMGTNLKGVFNGLREAARRLRPEGRIVNLSSSVVGVYGSGYGIYGATKAAVEAMTHVLSKELGERRITVNAVAPGPVGTELFLADKSDEQIAGITKMIPLGRLGNPDDIANVVSFLASPGGGWVNGQILRANGGMI